MNMVIRITRGLSGRLHEREVCGITLLFSSTMDILQTSHIAVPLPSAGKQFTSMHLTPHSLGSVTLLLLRLCVGILILHLVLLSGRWRMRDTCLILIAIGSLSLRGMGGEVRSMRISI